MTWVNWVIRLFARWRGWALIETIDFDGDVRLRRLYRDRTDRLFCHRIGPHRWCEVLPDGTVRGGHYITQWRTVLQGHSGLLKETPQLDELQDS
jgi:hypothetical protein